MTVNLIGFTTLFPFVSVFAWGTDGVLKNTNLQEYRTSKSISLHDEYGIAFSDILNCLSFLSLLFRNNNLVNLSLIISALAAISK